MARCVKCNVKRQSLVLTLLPSLHVVHCSYAARHALPAEKRVIAREKWEEWSASEAAFRSRENFDLVFVTFPPYLTVLLYSTGICCAPSTLE
jgi:hypothetical protein